MMLTPYVLVSGATIVTKPGYVFEDVVQFERLIEELLPVLHVHFLRQGIKSSMFCSQWFLTLFSYR